MLGCRYGTSDIFLNSIAYVDVKSNEVKDDVKLGNIEDDVKMVDVVWVLNQMLLM